MIEFRDPSNNLLQPQTATNFLSKDEINNIFRGLESIPFQEGMIGNEEKITKTSSRKSQIKWIPFSKEWEWLYLKFNQLISSANEQFFLLNIKDMPEWIQYTEYSSEYDGKYEWHTDLGVDYPSSHRKISVTVQLSSPSEYEGGYLQLFSNSKNALNTNDQKGLPPFLQNSPKELGNATIFPSFIPHRVTTVTKGVRKSLVIWVGGTTFK